ncbi:MAG TPA: hypothetical protein VD931_15275 [Baekduia sp.]|nr:hypothetical protein [Baekduia sp.]
MRRKLPLAVAAAAALGLGIGAGVQADDEGPAPARGEVPAVVAPTAEAAPVAHHRGLRGRHGMVARVVLGSLAGRLGVERDDLRDAAHEVAREEAARAADRAGLSSAQRNVLRACHTDRRSCDRSAASKALRRLKAAGVGDLETAKARVAGRLADELGIAQERVLEGVRAELARRLRQGAALGMVSARTRRLALGCFDAPATCDLAALRRAAHAGHPRRHHFR